MLGLKMRNVENMPSVHFLMFFNSKPENSTLLLDEIKFALVIFQIRTQQNFNNSSQPRLEIKKKTTKILTSTSKGEVVKKVKPSAPGDFAHKKNSPSLGLHHL